MLQRFRKNRLLKVSLTCALLIAVVFITIASSSGTWASSSKSFNYVGKIWEELSGDKSLNTALEKVGAMVVSKENAPKWMVQEILDEPWLDGAITNADQTVFWISRYGEVEIVKSNITNALADKGWKVASVDSSENVIETYIKTEGECRWLLAEYAQSGEETIAVLRTERN